MDLAIHEAVDLLALSGDVIDKESKSYEALGPMQAGLAKLNDAGIETVAVAGNHDHDVLERLVDIAGTERFYLLGKGGEWERYTLVVDREPALHVDGWSFPGEHTSDPPLRTHPRHPDDGVPVMGLVHGDVGVPLSSYAPISLDDLWARPWQFTLLGHIHAPQVFDGPAGKSALYPGSPWALDPGEPGLHGAWMVSFDENHRVELRQLPISPVRYDRATIDLDGIEDESGFQHTLTDALRELGRTAISEHGDQPLKVVSARVNVVGRCPAYRHVPQWIARARRDIDHFPVDSIVIEIDRITSSVRPPIDLRRLAQGADPAAETARLIIALDRSSIDPLYRELVDQTLRDLRSIHEQSMYASLRSREGDEEGPTEADARSLLKERAWHMMTLLVAHKEEA